MNSLIISLLLAVFAQAQVGFLQIYNHSQSSVMPKLRGQSMMSSNLEPDTPSSVFMIKPGRYQLSIHSAEGLLLSKAITIIAEKTSTMCLVSLMDVKTKKSTLTLITLNYPIGEQELILCSLSPDISQAHLLGQDYSLPLGKPFSVQEWKGQAFQLKVDGDLLGKIIPEEPISHSLFIWKETEGEVRSALIPYYKQTTPKNLREDLTFGREREQIKGLKTLNPIAK